jgi:hypothetical protein
MKKTISSLSLLLIITTILNAQVTLKANAGNDTLFCINGNNPQDSNRIGGNHTASGGTAPYIYEWKLYSKSTKNESTFFNYNGINNHVSNPFLDRTVHFILPDTCGSYVLKVTVTDANKDVAVDSSNITISTILIGDLMLEPFLPDSIRISPMIDGGIAPLMFNWTPAIGVSNPHIQNPTIKQMYPNTSYSIEITDASGCKFNFTDIATITNIKNGDLNTGFVTFRNPVLNNGTMNFTSDLHGSILRVCSVAGVIVYETKVQESNIPLGELIQNGGIYFYTVTTLQGKVISGQFVRE